VIKKVSAPHRASRPLMIELEICIEIETEIMSLYNKAKELIQKKC
jgi:hypothetical protein